MIICFFFLVGYYFCIKAVNMDGCITGSRAFPRKHTLEFFFWDIQGNF